MENKNIKQPATAFASPRFCNTGNFMRMERVNSAEGLDFAIYGIPLTQQLLIAESSFWSSRNKEHLSYDEN